MSDSFIPLSIPNLSGKELEYVSETIETGWVSSVGSYVDAFENAFAEKVGTDHAVATVNGTAALHVALRVCGVEAGDEVLVPDLTFVAPVNAVRYCHADPVFMDAEWESFGMDVNKVENFLKEECVFKDGHSFNKKSGARIKAIIPVHINGFPMAIEELEKLCSSYNIELIEDSSESLGSSWNGRMTGTFGKVSCFSFNGNKIITSGGGGMITTNDPELAERAKHLSTTAKSDPVEYVHDDVGYNYRLVNVLAALGLAQLEQLDAFLEIKQDRLAKYEELLSDIPSVHIKRGPENCFSNYWLYCLMSDAPFKESFREIARFFSERKVQVRPLWTLMTTLPIYKNAQAYHCENSKRIHERSLSIPSSTSITYEEQKRVVKAIREYFDEP